MFYFRIFPIRNNCFCVSQPYPCFFLLLFVLIFNFLKGCTTRVDRRKTSKNLRPLCFLIPAWIEEKQQVTFPISVCIDEKGFTRVDRRKHQKIHFFCSLYDFLLMKSSDLCLSFSLFFKILELKIIYFCRMTKKVK